MFTVAIAVGILLLTCRMVKRTYNLLGAALIFLLTSNQALHGQCPGLIIDSVRVDPTCTYAIVYMPDNFYNDEWIGNDLWDDCHEELTTEIYSQFEDNFDFIIYLLLEDSTPSGVSTGQFFHAKNEISGIGLSIFDNTANFGSDGHLQGVIQLGRRRNLFYGPSIHELMHNWANFGLSSWNNFGPHWGLAGVYGVLGGFDQNTLALIDGSTDTYEVNTNYSFSNQGSLYSTFELYLMGLIELSQVPAFDVFPSVQSYNFSSPMDTFISNSVVTYDNTEIENNYGARNPAFPTAQTDFKTLVAFITNTPLTSSQNNNAINDVIQFGLTGPSSGVGGGNNFWEATGGLATMETNNICASVILPVDLSEFTASGDDGKVRLEWRTSMEIGNDHFIVQRSKDAKNWERIALISGAGESNIKLHYQFVDENPYHGISYYRLKQVDFNGEYSYSNIEVIELLSDWYKVHIYPNPIDGKLFISGDKEELNELITYDITGKKIGSIKRIIDGDEAKAIIDLSNSPPGIYFVRTKSIIKKVYKIR